MSRISRRSRIIFAATHATYIIYIIYAHSGMPLPAPAGAGALQCRNHCVGAIQCRVWFYSPEKERTTGWNIIN
jgi:hypothetical protein